MSSINRKGEPSQAPLFVVVTSNGINMLPMK